MCGGLVPYNAKLCKLPYGGVLSFVIFLDHFQIFFDLVIESYRYKSNLTQCGAYNNVRTRLHGIIDFENLLTIGFLVITLIHFFLTSPLFLKSFYFHVLSFPFFFFVDFFILF